jgi:putative phosphoribosyl transferase
MFANRRAAGRLLADRVARSADADAVVLALPRGGVPVGYEVAAKLGVPLDVIVVRKLGVPRRRELAMGAIGESGVVVIDARTVRDCGVQDAEIDAVITEERHSLDRQLRDYRGGRAAVGIAGRTAILVDDGLATGATARAACEVARRLGPRRIVVAVPVAPPDTVAALRGSSDDVICVATPEPFFAVGQWYDDFGQVSDSEVRKLLEAAPRHQT